MFDVGSRDAWALVQGRLRALGLEVDEVDRKNQVVRTKWRHFLRGGWLPEPQVPVRYLADRIRFLVFVSPFAEPARVYVGSQMELKNKEVRGARGFSYNVPSANRALMEEIDAAFAAASLPKYAPSDADPCRQAKGTGPGQITRPEKIPLSEFEVLFPRPAVKGGVDGRVVLELRFREDGGVSDSRVVSPPVGEQLEAAAQGAASLLLFSPYKVDDCPAEFVVNQEVRFRLY
jgi:TonB family protein